jgi:hypothetical protein
MYIGTSYFVMFCLPDVIARGNSEFFTICSNLVFKHRLDLDSRRINQLLPVEFKAGAGETQSLPATGDPAPKSLTHLRIQTDSIKPKMSFRFERTDLHLNSHGKGVAHKILKDHQLSNCRINL